MNQLFYNIAGGIFKSDAKNGQQYQKWMLAVSEILSKIGIGFISNFLLEARVSYLTILKRKNLSLPLKVETDQFVICLVLPDLSKFVAFRPRTVKRLGTSLMPSLLFLCFSLFLSHLRTLAQEKRSEICLRFRTSGPSLCLYPLSSRNKIFSPR